MFYKMKTIICCRNALGKTTPTTFYVCLFQHFIMYLYNIILNVFWAWTLRSIKSQMKKVEISINFLKEILTRATFFHSTIMQGN